MISEALTLREPWGWLIAQGQPFHTTTRLDGWGTPRLLFPVAQKPPTIALPTGQGSLPFASFPFLLGANGVQAFHLPTDPRHEHGEFPFTLLLPDGAVELRQIYVVPRPPNKRGEQSSSPNLGSIVDAWIDWQIWAFQELGHLPEQPGDFDALTRAACVRRSWEGEGAVSVWFRDGRDEPRMALIVQLSREQTLHRALDAISRHPRRILQRDRDETPVSRIQELDPACIRDFARRPGITPVEKAGPRQRLLAVRRREQYTTLENQVTCWVMESATALAHAYCRANAAFSSDTKVGWVRAFGQRNGTWRTSEWLRGITTLHHHPTGPNYPLQFESRYKLVWKTYLRIRGEKRVKDDAWAWQRVLWSETGRQLIGCCLHLCNQFKPVAVGTPYYRTESRQGLWTEPPVAPGPFRTPWGDCIVFDSRDLDSASGRTRQRWLERPPFRGAEYIGASGCDQVLLWPKRDRALLVWYFYHTALGCEADGLKGILARCGQALEQLTVDMHRFARSQLQLSGLLFVADLGRDVTQLKDGGASCVVLEPGPRLRSGGAVNALCLPPDVDTWPQFVPDLREGFQLVIEELLGEL